MKRLALLLGTLALAPWLPSRGHAQTNQAIENPLVVKRAGEQVESAQYVYGTVADCKEDVEFEFAMDFAAPVPIWEAWLGVGSTNCSMAASRTATSTTTGARPVCKLLGTDREATAKPRIKIKARQMFSKNWPPGDVASQNCDQARNQLYTIYLLPLSQETNLSSNTASEPITIGTSQTTRKAAFTLYTLPPNPPTNIRGVTGESQIGVKFDIQEGAVAKTQYRAYFDWGKDGPGECGSGVLDPPDGGLTGGEMDAGDEDIDAGVDDAGAADADAGTDDTDDDTVVEGTQPPPEGTEDVSSVTVSSGEAYLKNLGSKGIEIGDFVSVAVVQVDPAENESALSAPVCVERVQTAGFLDNCKEDPDCKDGFTSCSLSAGQRTSGLVGLGALVGLASALVLRRRRRV